MSHSGTDEHGRPIVAELGRAETPQETAERKAVSSAKRRSNQTVINLVIAVVASLGIVAFLLVVVVRPDAPPRDPIDYATVAAEAQPTVNVTLVAPKLPAGWTANRAEIDDDNPDGVTTWEIGFLTPSGQYIGMSQGIGADAGWVAQQLTGIRSTGQQQYGGLDWDVYDQRSAKDPGNHAYSLVAVADGSTYLLSGTAPGAEFETLAEAIAAEVGP